MDSRLGACWRCGGRGQTRCAPCELALYCSSECQQRDKFRHEVECTNCAVQHKCSTCSKVTRDAKMCASCEKSWYCNPACQKADWFRHKSACKETQQKIVQVATALREHFDWMQKAQKLNSFPYYWGNSPAIDLIKIDQNEGEYPDKMAVLLAGVGNLRNVMATVAGLKQSFEGRVHFVLNDVDRQVLARNVFFLHFLWKYKGEEKVARWLTQIWYSVKIAEEEAVMAQECLTELLALPDDTNTLCGGRVTMAAAQWAELRKVFELWLALLIGENALQVTPQEQLRILFQLHAQGVDNYYDSIPPRHRASAEDWYRDGILLPKSDPRRKHACRDNLTLAAWNPTYSKEMKETRGGLPSTAQWVGEIAAAINDDGVPFSEWDYLEVKAKYHQKDLLKMYSHYIDGVVSRFADMFDQGHVSCHVILSDCLSVQAHLPDDTVRFDRIFTSNVSDYVNYPVLLEALRPLLRKENNKSVIITESINWGQLFPQEVIRPLPTNVPLWIGLFRQAVEDLRDEPDRPNWAKGQTDYLNARKTSVIEYFDNWDLYNQYLRAALLAHRCPESSHPALSTKDVPKMSEVRNVSGMKMQNFLKELNTVCPFRYRINARRVNLLSGHERMLEWTLANSDGHPPGV